MARRPPFCCELDGFPGWSWRVLAREDLPLAWPLARLAGAACDLEGWLELAGRWLAEATAEGGGVGALVNPAGLLLGLEWHRPRPGRRLDGSTLEAEPVLEVPWLAALEVTPEPRCHAALLSALESCARTFGCAAIRLTRSGPTAEELDRLAGRLGLVPVPEGWCWTIGRPRAAADAPPAHDLDRAAGASDPPPGRC